MEKLPRSTVLSVLFSSVGSTASAINTKIKFKRKKITTIVILSYPNIKLNKEKNKKGIYSGVRRTRWTQQAFLQREEVGLRIFPPQRLWGLREVVSPRGLRFQPSWFFLCHALFADKNPQLMDNKAR